MKVHTKEAQNQHQLKFPVSTPSFAQCAHFKYILMIFFDKFMYNWGLKRGFTFLMDANTSKVFILFYGNSSKQLKDLKTLELRD